MRRSGKTTFAAARALRALSEAAEIYPGARRVLLTLTRDGMPADAPADIVVQSAYAWFLSEPEE